MVVYVHEFFCEHEIVQHGRCTAWLLLYFHSSYSVFLQSEVDFIETRTVYIFCFHTYIEYIWIVGYYSTKCLLYVLKYCSFSQKKLHRYRWDMLCACLRLTKVHAVTLSTTPFRNEISIFRQSLTNILRPQRKCRPRSPKSMLVHILWPHS